MAIPRARFRGFISNPDAGLFLPFMLNPQPLTINKTVNWETEAVPGLAAPVHYFQSGGEKIISFNTFFDNSAAGVSSNLYPFVNPVGVRGIESILEAFLNPQATSITNGEFNLAGAIKFKAPPLCTLVLGLRFWNGYLVSAPLEETKFNTNLTPTQFSSTLEFSVVEDGVINEANVLTRNGLALAESGVNLFNFSIDI
ncbi:hypothetical protein Molly5_89 [Maribacter phage Molly_5]|uniref:Uncharacterized protein n=2 Tax=Mollyvirus TaxID=2948826 RepID=A0A8E4UY32_9CAUD|nr:hypothetical protein M1M29_gp089 [Maribacter phage Molly_1]YP_010357336.1 hypothetical protein M1M30_gp087 [Maribacter phage Colly_1]QQO97776.1 hypothetical protein Molly2_89 [Maribacter phage Molly_2]QQO97976.1 hypothetical protein Molly3_89 [Maribacter phage Molly_3]QQO98176.1 hypothetical protein Molly4_89 [Maribacter phage Molly_4]QQO98376.1 hypothetical protein Molly5_89 [Maribacter phage Molly_5]QQO97374.1 hypothetical protein Colly1_87 [Maribacter phage Colly_1]